ncbi:MAG TPA: hypothetical protein VLC71_10090 [Thermomonas sp.]|nr:hypothetical protein [Thermomonas sp.]
MLSFATEFPISDEQTTGDFLAAVKDWALGLPHTVLNAQDLSALGSVGQWSFQKGNESVVSLHATNDRGESASVRYKRVDDGLEWTTTVTFSRSVGSAWVAIRVFCESNHPAARLPPAKKPVLVRTLLQSLGGGKDGDLHVITSPHILGNSDIGAATRLITGEANCRLPIIYVSATFQGSHILDINRLANDMAGVAHVVVEPNRPFSLRLKLEANSENVYGGTVGIYWPDGGGRRSFFIGKGFDSASDMARAVFDEVRTALTNRRPLERCTWASTQEMVSRQTFEQLKASGSDQVDKYIAAFDEELASKDQKLSDAEREIGRLKAELRIYESRSSPGIGAALEAGQEQDLFPNEISGIILDALRDYQFRVPQDSRRSHVVAALLASNPGNDESAQFRERLKEMLRGFTGLDGKVRRGLEDLGFSISEEGKHYKITFQGDDRYTFTLPKSGSDHRGGLNAANDIGRLLF